jgi:hypothetical protein
MAIAWIALETAIGWATVRFRRKPRAEAGSAGTRPDAGAARP